MKKYLFIKLTKNKGRGVFCNRLIQQDEDIEICPVVVLPAKDYKTLTTSHLVDYFFNFNRDENKLALVLGFGSIYNHAVNSNAAYILDRATKTVRFYALEDIAAGTEICINYAGERGLEFKEWFESRGIAYKGI